MHIQIVEATNRGDVGGGLNWGKFLVGRFTDEWSRASMLPGLSEDLQIIARLPLLQQRGWGERHIMVFDLETGEGAVFRHGGLAKADLHKHKIWVCPLFEPFLEWLYEQPFAGPKPSGRRSRASR